MSTRDQDRRLTVPKFSSFRAAKEPSNDSGGDVVSKARDKSRSSHRSDRHRDSSRRRESGRHREHRNRSRSPSRTEPHVAPKSPAITALPGVFVVDTKPDPLISKYGGIDRSKIPAYYRHGAGRILGAEGRLVVHREGARDQFSIRRPGEGFGQKDGLRIKRLRFPPQPFLLRRKGDAEKEENEGYLLVDSKKRKREQNDDPDSSDDNEQSYRSIKGKAKVRAIESESESESDASIQVGVDDPLKLRSIQLNRHVKEHPGDIDSWLELVNHQDVLLRAGQDFDRDMYSEAHSYAEIKVSMLESALANTSTPEDRSRLLVYLMREGVKVWTGKTASKKWADVAKDEEDNFLLWKSRLDFSMSNIKNFRYEEVKTMLLTRIHQALSRSPEPTKADIEEAVYTLARTARFIHDAGYKELAVAAWQALLELNLSRPSKFDSTRDALESFQDFWESEVPRIGDKNAQGWHQFVQSGGVGDAPEPRQDPRVSNGSRAYKAWAKAEQLSAQTARMPARTMDEGTEDDPFRVVMYSDIEPLLFLIPEHLLHEVIPQLVDAFLLFCGLPSAFRLSEWTEMAERDQYLTSLGPIGNKPAWEIRADAEETTRKAPTFSDREIQASVSADLLFSKEWFSYLGAQNPGHTVDRSWVLAVAKQLVLVVKMEGLAPYYMALCLAEDPSTIKKQARALLKQYPTNIELYCGYALTEYANGKADVAINVLRSAAEVALASKGPGKLLFWRHWSWIELDTGSKVSATTRLCSAVDESLRAPEVSFSSAHVLKAQRQFASGFQECVAARDLDGANAYGECHVLLSYLTAEGSTEPTSGSQGNISAAMSTVDAISQGFRSWGHHTSPAHERVLQLGARLLYFHASKGPFRRLFMQEQLARFIEVFPRNSIFLSLFEWTDSSIRVIDETRSLLYDKVLSPSQDCVSSRVFAVRHELARGNANSTKAAFEHAISSDACKSSVSLWVSYIRFCGSQKELRAKTKEVFYAALSNCPWSKEVMMEAFALDVMKAEDLRAVHDMMASKGLRIHVELDDSGAR